MQTYTHVRLVGHLKFLLKAMQDPAYIREHYQICRKKVVAKKGRSYVYKYYFQEPETGVLVPVNANDIGFGGISSYGRPVVDTLWGNATALCNSITPADDDMDEYYLPPYNELLECIRQVGTDPSIIKQASDPETLEIVKERTQKMIDIAARFDELNAPIDPNDIMYAYGIDIASKRYELYKTNAGLELIKALRLVRHPTVRRNLAVGYGRVLRDVNIDLAEVLIKIK